MDVGNIARGISIWGLPVLFAIIFHEVAHGWVAEKFGDSTARRAGRITLNPISHIDPIGTVLLPLILIVMGSKFLFGWAKPVPVNFSALRNPKRDMIWVALSGPGTNFVLASLSAIIIRIMIVFSPDFVQSLFGDNSANELTGNIGLAYQFFTPIFYMLCASVFINIVLMILNLIPVPPLDGGRILVGLLPPRAAYQYSKVEPYGIMIIALLLFMIPFTKMLFSTFIVVFLNLFSLMAGISVYSVLALKGFI
jgi:Zn-dependent protease